MDRRVDHVQAGGPPVLNRHAHREFVELLPGFEIGRDLIDAIRDREDARALERGRAEELVPDGVNLPNSGNEEPEAVGILFGLHLTEVLSVQAEIHDLGRYPGLDSDPVAGEKKVCRMLDFARPLAGLQDLEDELSVRPVTIKPVSLGEIQEIERTVRAEGELLGAAEDCFVSVIPDPQDLFELDDASGVLGDGTARVVDARLRPGEPGAAQDEEMAKKDELNLGPLNHIYHPEAHHKTPEGGKQACGSGLAIRFTFNIKRPKEGPKITLEAILGRMAHHKNGWLGPTPCR